MLNLAKVEEIINFIRKKQRKVYDRICKTPFLLIDVLMSFLVFVVKSQHGNDEFILEVKSFGKENE